jgi:hypothetical protein
MDGYRHDEVGLESEVFDRLLDLLGEEGGEGGTAGILQPPHGLAGATFVGVDRDLVGEISLRTTFGKLMPNEFLAAEVAGGGVADRGAEGALGRENRVQEELKATGP